jgi:group I intron endonuclease
MAIYKAILKYGYSNFALEILEYCDPKDVLVREQYYIDLLKPEYNILSTAGSSFGYKHTEETLDKFKLRVFSDEARANLAASATGRVLSEETKAKISAARSGIKLSAETRAKLSAATAAIQGVAVEVTNIKTGETEQFTTMTDAAASLGVSRTTIKNIIRSGKILRGSYSIKIKDQ